MQDAVCTARQLHGSMFAIELNGEPREDCQVAHGA